MTKPTIHAAIFSIVSMFPPPGIIPIRVGRAVPRPPRELWPSCPTYLRCLTCFSVSGLAAFSMALPMPSATVKWHIRQQSNCDLLALLASLLVLQVVLVNLLRLRPRDDLEALPRTSITATPELFAVEIISVLLLGHLLSPQTLDGQYYEVSHKECDGPRKHVLDEFHVLPYQIR